MKTRHKAAIAGGALVLAVSFIKPWEGLWTTAQVDRIGTGRPITYCYGQTDEFGKVRVGEKFTPQECSNLLQQSLPKYWNGIAPCIHVPLPDKAKAALISAAYNAGPVAVCHSPMLARMNAGNIMAGCLAFKGWYIRARGVVVRGLINRRNGESKLCMEGVNERPPTLWQFIMGIGK